MAKKATSKKATPKPSKAKKQVAAPSEPVAKTSESMAAAAAEAVLLKLPPPDARLVSLAQLKAWDKNPRIITEEAVDKLITVIKGIGKWGAPLLIQKATSRIIAGHTRIRAAEKMGLPEVPCLFIDCTDQEADQLAVADNRLGENTEWNFEGLASILKGLPDEAARLLTGFEAHEIEPLMAADWQPPALATLPGAGAGDGHGAEGAVELTAEERVAFNAAVEWMRRLYGEELTEGETVSRLAEKFVSDCEAEAPEDADQPADTRAKESGAF
jgi:ParB-like chromosome segregation protein Spo0J